MIPVIILARGGSKGLPGKNIKTFCGKPLLAWSILRAPKPVYVSSDSEEILAVAQQYGAIGVKRPPELATDTATSESAIAHVLDHIEVLPQLVVFLPPTSPLRLSGDIPGALRVFQDSGADSLFSACVLNDLCAWTKESGELRGATFDPMNRGRRQDRKPIYLENGSIYIFKPEVLRAGNRLGGKIASYIMQPWQQYEIDDAESFDLCRYQFIKHGLDK